MPVTVPVLHRSRYADAACGVAAPPPVLGVVCVVPSVPVPPVSRQRPEPQRPVLRLDTVQHAVCIAARYLHPGEGGAAVLAVQDGGQGGADRVDQLAQQTRARPHALQIKHEFSFLWFSFWSRQSPAAGWEGRHLATAGETDATAGFTLDRLLAAPK